MNDNDCPCGLNYPHGHMVGSIAGGVPQPTPSACFFVYNLTTGGSPKRRHATHKAALDEAVRLANQHAGQEFVVLVPHQVVMARVQPVEVRDLNTLPSAS